jgi:hypothetical protein
MADDRVRRAEEVLRRRIQEFHDKREISYL